MTVGHVLPVTDAAFSIGNATHQWANVYAASLNGNSGSHILTLNNQASGTATQISLTGSDIATLGDISSTGNITPATDATYELGDATHQWTNVFAASLNGNSGSHILTLNNQNSSPATQLSLTSSQISVQGNLISTNAVSYTLGDSGNYWGSCFLGTIHVATGVTAGGGGGMGFQGVSGTVVFTVSTNSLVVAAPTTFNGTTDFEAIASFNALATFNVAPQLIVAATPAAQVLTLTNAPTATGGGNPDAYFEIVSSGTTYVIPAWAI
jgi:hypothetical protein